MAMHQTWRAQGRPKKSLLVVSSSWTSWQDADLKDNTLDLEETKRVLTERGPGRK